MSSRFRLPMLAITATAVLAQPFVANAAPQAAMDACVKAFVAANLSKDQPVTIRKEFPLGSPLTVLQTEYTIAVTAKSRTTGESLAKATCTVDRASGAIVAMNGVATPTLADVIPAKPGSQTN